MQEQNQKTKSPIKFTQEKKKDIEDTKVPTVTNSDIRQS